MYYLCRTEKYSFYSKVLNLLREFVIPTKEGTVLIHEMIFGDLNVVPSRFGVPIRRDDKLKTTIFIPVQ